MKKFLILVFSFLIFGCETQNVEIQKSGGIWNLNDGVFNADGQSKKAIIGSDEDLEIAMEFFNAYKEMNPQRMVELSADIIKFHPADIPGIVDVDATNTKFIEERQSTFEKVERTVVNVTPIAVEGSENYTVVEINFNETITHKNGELSSAHYFERIHVENKKVTRVVQWKRPM